LPTFLVAASIKAGRLARLLADFGLQEEGLVVRPPGVYVPAKVRGLIGLMVDKFGTEPSWIAPSPNSPSSRCAKSGRPSNRAR
jgi:hypothetical protein